MDFTPDRSRLRYVDADDLDDSTVNFDGMDVKNTAGEKLGDVDGFILDVTDGRPYYVVVDSGGWFKSKLYLIPIGHARLSTDDDHLLADLTRERITRFPGFDRHEFEKLSDDDLDRMDDELAAACCPTELRNQSAASRADRWSHYRYPDWWSSNYYRPDRAGARGVTAGAELHGEPSDRNVVWGERREERVKEAEATVAREGGDVSPHLGGRAQPGDVIGIETGGERTYVGSTSEDEDQTRRAGEKAAGKDAKKK